MAKKQLSVMDLLYLGNTPQAPDPYEDSPSVRSVTGGRSERVKGKRTLPAKARAKDYANTAVNMAFAARPDAVRRNALAVGQRIGEALPDAIRNFNLSDLVPDVGRYLDYVGNDTANAIADFNVVGAGRDFLRDFERAAELRAQGRDEEAADLEKFALPFLALGAIPGGKGAKKLGAVASEFGPDVARRLEGMIEETAPLSVWREAAQRLSATEGSNAPRLTRVKQLENAPYNPSEFDVKVRDKPATEATRGLYEEKTGVQQPSEISIQNLIGRPFITSMADRTAAMRRLLGVNNTIFNDPVDLLGGQDFMFDPTTQGLVWASEPGVVSNLRNMARVLADKYGSNPLYLPFRMGGSGSDFSTMTGETMMRYAAENMGKRDIARANAMLQGALPWKDKFAGIETPLGVEQYRNLPGKYRVELARMMGGMAPQGGLTIGQTRLLIADPRQIDAPKFAVQNVGEIDPYADTVLGSGHPAFFGGLKGQGLGTLAEEDINVMELLPELAERFRVAEPDIFAGSPTKLTPEEAAIHGASRMDPGYLLRTVPQSGVIDESIVEQILRRRRERGE